MYTHRFTQPTGVNSYLALDSRDQARIDRIIAILEIDPAPDGWTKVTRDFLGKMYTQYRDHDGYWVLYHLVHTVIWIVSCGRGANYTDLEKRARRNGH